MSLRVCQKLIICRCNGSDSDMWLPLEPGGGFGQRPIALIIYFKMSVNTDILNRSKKTFLGQLL